MTVLPFICLAIGIILGLFIKIEKFPVMADKVMTVALIFLMLAIGVGIGLDETIIKNALKIGFSCIVISLFAIFFSVLFTVICEKTVLPLKKIDDELRSQNIDTSILSDGTEDKKGSHLVWIMPLSVILGIMLGIFFRANIDGKIIDWCFTLSLILLYICVGISQGANKEVFGYIKKLGFRILWLSLAIIAGSLIGGIISGLILDLPINISVISAGGMSFYSITGAFMTDTYGLEVGTYGFIVNIMREVFTVLFMPLLIKISVGSPLSSGAAGDMDTMLAPITKFVGVRLGLVALITGTILTFVVPILLPILASIV